MLPLVNEVHKNEQKRHKICNTFKKDGTQVQRPTGKVRMILRTHQKYQKRI